MVSKKTVVVNTCMPTGGNEWCWLQSKPVNCRHALSTVSPYIDFGEPKRNKILFVFMRTVKQKQILCWSAWPVLCPVSCGGRRPGCQGKLRPASRPSWLLTCQAAGGSTYLPPLGVQAGHSAPIILLNVPTTS